MDAEIDDFPAGFGGGGNWAEVVYHLKCFGQLYASGWWLGLTHRPDDGLTKRQRYNQSPKGKVAMNRAARRKDLQSEWKKCKGKPEYRARKADEARRRRAAKRAAEKSNRKGEAP